MFLWRHRLDNLCLTYVLFPLISPVSIYSGFKKKLSPKEMFSILANNNIFFDHISHSYQGEVAQNEITYASRTTIPFQKSAACIQYSICSNNASLLSQDAHSSNYSTFQRRAAYIKGCYSQSMFCCLGWISYYVFREMMYNFEGHIVHAYIYNVVFI